MGGDAQTSQTTQQETQVPGFLSPFINQGIGTAGNALGRLEGTLGGATGADLVAGFDPLQQQAQQQLIDIAGGAGGFLPTAQQGLLDTAQGDFLFGNPGFDAAVNASLNLAQPRIASAFNMAGGSGDPLAGVALQQVASDAFARQFAQERSNQLGALRDLPGIAQIGPGILDSIGAARQGLEQQRINAPISAEQTLLQAALSGVPVENLLGQTKTFNETLEADETLGTIGGLLTGGSALLDALGLGGTVGSALNDLGGGLLGGIGDLFGIGSTAGAAGGLTTPPFNPNAGTLGAAGVPLAGSAGLAAGVPLAGNAGLAAGVPAAGNAALAAGTPAAGNALLAAGTPSGTAGLGGGVLGPGALTPGSGIADVAAAAAASQAAGGGGLAGTGLGAGALDAAFAASPLLAGAALSFGPVLAAKPLVDLLHDPVQDFGDALSGLLGTDSQNTPSSSAAGNSFQALMIALGPDAATSIPDLQGGGGLDAPVNFGPAEQALQGFFAQAGGDGSAGLQRYIELQDPNGAGLNPQDAVRRVAAELGLQTFEELDLQDSGD